MKKILILLAVVIVFFYFLCGIVVIQPLGAVPDGGTVVYFRPGTGLPFLTSPDGLLLDKNADVTLLGRGLSAAVIAKKVEGRRLVRLPYIKQLYLWSTGGREFEK